MESGATTSEFIIQHTLYDLKFLSERKIGRQLSLYSSSMFAGPYRLYRHIKFKGDKSVWDRHRNQLRHGS